MIARIIEKNAKEKLRVGESNPGLPRSVGTSPLTGGYTHHYTNAEEVLARQSRIYMNHMLLNFVLSQSHWQSFWHDIYGLSKMLGDDYMPRYVSCTATEISVNHGHSVSLCTCSIPVNRTHEFSHYFVDE